MTLFHAAIQGFLAVALGAFGAHGLAHVLDETGQRWWQTGNHYQMSHALALLALGLFERQRRVSLPFCHAAFSAGILLFSGSLYVLAVSGARAFGMIVPVGGLCFLAGWLLLAQAAWKS